MVSVTETDACLINTVPEHRLFPLGLAYIASFLESNNYEVSMIDLGPHFNKRKLSEVLSNQNYDVVGISCLTPFLQNAIHAAKISKKMNPTSETVLGGPHVTVRPEDLMKIDEIDIGVIGEGEITMVDLIKWKKNGGSLDAVNGIVYKKDGELAFTKPRKLIRNITALPFPAYHLFPLESYIHKDNDIIRGVFGLRVACMVASRGCPYHCIFCQSSKIHGKRIRYRDPRNVLAEMKYLMLKHDINAVYFYDDTFGHNPEWLRNLCREIIDKNVDISWACQVRVDSVDKNMLQAMKKAGCIQVEFGVESGSQRILDFLKKNISIKQIHNAVRICKSINIRTLANLMIGTPGEDLQDIRVTEQVVEELDPDYVAIWLTTPLPGTKLFEYAKKHGILTTFDYHRFRYDTPVMETGFLDVQTIQRIYKGLRLYYRKRNERKAIYL